MNSKLKDMLIQVALFVLFLTRKNEARTYETHDSIIIEADNSPLRDAVFDAITVDAERSAIDKPISQKVNPDDRYCLTYDKKQGTCQTIQECYPFTKVHQKVENLETWIIGTKGTCNYFEADGRQVYGVCCHLPTQVVNGTGKANSPEGRVLERIVGGVDSQTGEWPFMAGILNNGRLFCGGSLLDDRHVLTAAHCVSKLTSQDVSKLQIVLGANNLRSGEGLTKRVRSVTRHKQFDPVKLHYDIALITLDSPVQTRNNNNGLKPVCLGNERSISDNDGKEATVIGWGNIRDGSSYRPETLQKATLRIRGLDDCRQNFGSKAPGGIVDHFICAYAPGKDACSGDSGGPLLVNRCQVGIVSWGIGCATNNYGVYTRIASFQNWIDRNRIRF